MSNPTPSTTLATLRPDLAPFVEFDIQRQREGFIWNQVAPAVNVALAADSPGKIPVEQLLQGADGTEDRHAEGADYARITSTFDDFSYSCQEHGLEEAVSKRTQARYANIFDAFSWATARTAARVQANQEARVASLLYNTSVWNGAGLTTGITNEWDANHITDAVPITDVENACRKVWAGCGMWPNALILNMEQFRNLRLLDTVKAAISASGAGFPTRASDITREMLAAVFNLDYIIIAGAARNTAKKGKSASFSHFWSSEYAMVARVATSSDMAEPCVARTYHWTGDGSSLDGTVETYYDEARRSDIVRVRMDTDEVVMYPECAHLLSNVTTI